MERTSAEENPTAEDIKGISNQFSQSLRLSSEENTQDKETENNNNGIEKEADNLRNNTSLHDNNENISKNDDINLNDIPEGFVDSSESDDDDDTLEEDIIIDEEHLKELEKTMSEEDKIQRKDEALQFKSEGNDHFKEKKYEEATRAYSRALSICPLLFTKERSIMYSNRAASQSKLDLKEESIMDCSKALELNPNYMKALLRRAQLYRATDKLDEALTDYQKILEIDPNILEARQACIQLPEEIKERNEKLKTEMLGKLKELGNMVLRPFGLSTDNFNVVKDPNSGGYSINFKNGNK